jgi:hypothetical protein
MSSKKQTAVEYYDKIVSDIFQEFVRDEITKTELIVKIHNAFYPALKLEKEQIIAAYRDGRTDQQTRVPKFYNRSSAIYYTSTYE